MVRSKVPAQVPDRPTRLRICVAAECDERAVNRFFHEPERVRPALRSAIRRALPLVGLTDPHAGAEG
ncbi:MAG TPA: hypothetical protein VGI10_22765 [Polyangiaceae bacterium]|jgi:hypothetical protein